MSQIDLPTANNHPRFLSDLRTVIALALVPAIGLGIARFAYALLLPAMQSSLGWSYADAGWMTSVNAAGYMVAALLAARVIAYAGAYRVMAGGVIACVTALILLGVINDSVLLNCAWLLAGIGGAFAFVAGGVLATHVSQRHPKHSAFLLGLFYAGSGLGIALSGISVPWILSQWGESAWPGAWIVLATISSVLMLGMFYGARNLPENRTFQHTKSPILAMKWIIAGYCLFGAGYITYMTFMIAWIQSHDEGPIFQALFWIILGLGVAIFPWLWSGVLKSQHRGRAFAILNGLTMAGAALPLAFSTWPILLISAAVFGSSFFAVVASTTAYVRRNCPPSSWASGIGAMTLAFSIGQTFGPTFTGWLSDLTGNLSAGLLASVFLLIAASLLGLLQSDLNPS
ncbi:YbfB/YjiJ family MFS transporter [Halomonas sp. G11]|uniref:YbfB/YjiJ family MFS transporter n=1 Tax=Halomonas sp. G11 TaxID=1684425 RepID=UPI000B0ED5FF|nr:YbfB/YjiJ family MFS transporter [Halomonas sp. G11]